MATDREVLKQSQIGAVLGNVGSQGMVDPDGTVRQSHQRQVDWSFTDAATAATAVTETPIHRARVAERVKAVHVSVPIAVTASDTLFATFTLSKRTAGGGATVIATHTTKTSGGSGGLGNLTAFVENALNITAANVDLAVGDTLTFLVSKASTGTALTAATSTARVSVVLEEI